MHVREVMLVWSKANGPLDVLGQTGSRTSRRIRTSRVAFEAMTALTSLGVDVDAALDYGHFEVIWGGSGGWGGKTREVLETKQVSGSFSGQVFKKGSRLVPDDHIL